MISADKKTDVTASFVAAEAPLRFPDVVSATRMHVPQGATEIPAATEQHLRNYAVAVRALGTVAAIAVNALEADVARILHEAAPGLEAHVLPVPCWGAFVPALNALLGFAQQRGRKHILFHSLEVHCTPPILQHLLAHHTKHTLVVGAAMDGHVFVEGERPLDGRSAPWNTLCVWAVRKLSLTGFLCIADGLKTCSSPHEELQDKRGDDKRASPMGSAGWWTASSAGIAAAPLVRHESPDGQVPAGVEEVTAIALLQHLLGADDARAILLRLPAELEKQLCWKTSWAGDAAREKWHEYKMSSKISRPAAQLDQLFHKQRGAGKSLASMLFVGGSMLSTPAPVQDVAEKPSRSHQFGTVMHHGASIRPPPQVESICMACIFLFCANFTAILAAAFRELNTSGLQAGAGWGTTVLGLLIGGVYMPMPLSLFLTRIATWRGDHIAGLVLFASCFLISHMAVFLFELCGLQQQRMFVLLASRLVQGLGSGVGFQARFMLASLSTADNHMEVEGRSALAADIGLGFGALLPAALAALAGADELLTDAPEVLSSAVFALLSLVLLLWIALVFPRRLHVLPEQVRWGGPRARGSGCNVPAMTALRRLAWVSGTGRVFVQSAILPVAALSLRDAAFIGYFRQTITVAALCLLPVPFEAVASRVCCTCAARPGSRGGRGQIISGAAGAVMLLVVMAWPHTNAMSDWFTLVTRVSALTAVMIVQAVAVPFNKARLYQLDDAERSQVLLAWMQAYGGRLLGPIVAIAMYSSMGYWPVLATLCVMTAIVVVTA